MALSDLEAATRRSNPRGATPTAPFAIRNVPDGDYPLTLWDEPQDYCSTRSASPCRSGEVVDIGVQPLVGWFTEIDGYVFVDTNGNGKRDAGESGVPTSG